MANCSPIVYIPSTQCTSQRKRYHFNNQILSITFAIAVMSQSGVLGYQSGSGLLFGVVALMAQTGGRFSLLFDGDTNRRASGFLVPLTASAPGEATLLMKKPPPPVQGSLKAAPLPFLNSGILELYKQHTPEERQIRQTIASKKIDGVGNLVMSPVPYLPSPNPCSDSTQLNLQLLQICKNWTQKKRQDAKEMGG
jgi:hypothetical protein